MMPEFDEFFSDDPVAVYLAEVGKVPPLSREEELECITHVRLNDPQAAAAKQRLVEAHLKLVTSLAKMHGGSPTRILDLVQAGNEGLLAAANALVSSRAEEFAPFAKEFVECAMNGAPRARNS